MMKKKNKFTKYNFIFLFYCSTSPSIPTPTIQPNWRYNGETYRARAHVMDLTRVILSNDGLRVCVGRGARGGRTVWRFRCYICPFLVVRYLSLSFGGKSTPKQTNGMWFERNQIRAVLITLKLRSGERGT